MLEEPSTAEAWPSLHYDDWKDTAQTVHMWTQIVGKVRLAHEPMVNHWWQVVLYVTSRGLTTSPMPCSEGRTFQIDFDFIDHELTITDCNGARSPIALEPMPVAEFYAAVMNRLDALGIPTKINTIPNEIADGIPFDKDYTHKSYDKEYVHRFWRVLVQADRLCKAFRSGYIGKVSPVHFFWGGFDLAVTRFSGRRAPPHPGGFPNFPDSAVREAYSHEVSSCGFWPGGYGLDASFYAYAYPQPEGFSEAHASPDAASYNTQLREFILPYEAVRTASDPDAAVLSFFQSTYEAAADLGGWDRANLERR
jgi:Family of unknown function (DUF5996)